MSLQQIHLIFGSYPFDIAHNNFNSIQNLIMEKRDELNSMTY